MKEVERMKVLSIDIGASSGRHMLSSLDNGRWHMKEIHRFPKQTFIDSGVLCWNTEKLFIEILRGMRRCFELGEVPDAVGIDTWGVDFVLLDQYQKPLHPLVCYRDARTRGMDQLVEEKISFEILYQHTGIQRQIFNSLYQLEAIKDRNPTLINKAQYLLFTPDYFHFMLSGKLVNEYTIASTSSLLNVYERDWDDLLIQKLDLPRSIFCPIVEPGTALGELRPEIQKEVGFNCQVIVPASHDTACAFLAVPKRDEESVILSSGTWSLLGTIESQPIVTPQARVANFTNEGGYNCTIRFLKNIMGLWIIQNIREEVASSRSFAELEALARASSSYCSINVDDDKYLAPGKIFESLYEDLGKYAPDFDLGDVLNSVYHSLAEYYHLTIKELEKLTDREYSKIHIVGGGSQDSYLNQLTANATGLTVFSGPKEATAIGNAVVQFLSLKAFKNLDEATQCLNDNFDVNLFVPEEVFCG